MFSERLFFSKQVHTEMTDRKNTKTQSVAEHDTLQTQKQIEEKKEQARRLLKGGTQKNKAKAVELLEDCVALGDADSMLTLAKCYVLGCGIEQNTERAEELLSECARSNAFDEVPQGLERTRHH